MKDASLPGRPDEHERIQELAGTLAANGLDRTKEIVFAIGDEHKSISPEWFQRNGQKPSIEIAACLVRNVLELLVLTDEYTILLAGPMMAPEFVENPSLLFGKLFEGEGSGLCGGYDVAGLSNAQRIIISREDVMFVVKRDWAIRATKIPFATQVANALNEGALRYESANEDAARFHLTARAGSAIDLRPELLFNLFAPLDEGGATASGTWVHALGHA